jgi:hypothetical protein
MVHFNVVRSCRLIRKREKTRKFQAMSFVVRNQDTPMPAAVSNTWAEMARTERCTTLENQMIGEVMCGISPAGAVSLLYNRLPAQVKTI